MIKIFKPNGNMTEYEYIYQDDTLCIERITRIGNRTIFTKKYYDKKNREVKAIDFNECGSKTGTYSKTKYNDKKRTKELKIYVENKLVNHKKTNYDSCHIINVSNNENGKINCPDKVKFEKIINYNNQGLDLVMRTIVITKKCTTLGLIGPISLTPDDVVIDEQYRHPNGLIEFEKQYLNGKLVGTKRYKYIRYE